MGFFKKPSKKDNETNEDLSTPSLDEIKQNKENIKLTEFNEEKERYLISFLITNSKKISFVYHFFIRKDGKIEHLGVWNTDRGIHFKMILSFGANIFPVFAEKEKEKLEERKVNVEKLIKNIH